jgi:hypothetical protein
MLLSARKESDGEVTLQHFVQRLGYEGPRESVCTDDYKSRECPLPSPGYHVFGIERKTLEPGEDHIPQEQTAGTHKGR